MTVKGIYKDGTIRLLKDVKLKEDQEVIVYLPEHRLNEVNQDIYKLAESGGSFDFLNDPAEDIYSDEDLKVKYHD